jgi:uncharacterized membrane protein
MTKLDQKASIWGRLLLAVFALAVGAYALLLYGSPANLRAQEFVVTKGNLPELWYNVLWVHAISGGTALAIGWLQFIKRLRAKAPNLHRTVGMLYVIMIAVSGITGLYMAYYAGGGLSGRLGFGTLAVLWLYTLYRGMHSIFSLNNISAHGRWMTRNYALTCAAIMLRIYTPLAAVLFGLDDTNGSLDSFTVIAWLCWVPNLLFAEWLIRNTGGRRRRRGRRPLF